MRKVHSSEKKKRTHLVVGVKLVSNTNTLELVTLAFLVEGRNEFGKTVVGDLDDRVGETSRRIRFGGKGKSGNGGGCGGGGGGTRGKVVTRVASAHYERCEG